MSRSADELKWTQPKHRMYQAIARHGCYWIIAQDRNWQFNSRLLFVPAEKIPYEIFTPPKQQLLAVLLAHGRIRFLTALDNDPENEMLTVLEAMKVTYLRDVVEDLKPCFE